MDVYNLKQSCEQAEEALSQGMEKLQQTLAETVAAGHLGEGSYIPQMSNAMEKLEALISFVNQVITHDYYVHQTIYSIVDYFLESLFPFPCFCCSF